jgi:hypothetical protein
MASQRDKTKFFLSSLDVYVGGTGAANLVAYTDPGTTFRMLRDVASAESTKDGKRVIVRRDSIRQGAEFEGAFKQFDIDTFQMIMGGTIASGSGYEKLSFGSSSGLPTETLWGFKGQNVDGDIMWLVFPKGQIMSPIEVALGGEEHASIPFTVGANIDETMTAVGDEFENLYYWRWETT